MTSRIKTVIISAVLLLLLAAGPRAHASDQITIYTYESGTELTAVIQANDLTEPVIGLAFDLAYDPAVLRYFSYDEGAFFENGGEPIYLVTYDIDHRGGRVIVGVTLRRTDQEVSLSGTIIAINFDIFNKTTTELNFKNAIISKINDQNKREDLGNIEWIDTVIYMEDPKVVESIINEAGSEIQEELIPLESIEDETVLNTGMTSVFEVKDNFVSVIAVVVSMLSLLCAICYIAWRKINKRRHAIKTANSCIRKPPPQTTA